MLTRPLRPVAKVLSGPHGWRAALLLWSVLLLVGGCKSGQKVNQWSDGKYYSAREIAQKKRDQRRIDRGVAKAKDARARENARNNARAAQARAREAQRRAGGGNSGGGQMAGPATGAPATTRQAAELIRVARTYTGTPYRSGGTTRLGMDCSGLISTTFQEAGYDLPRTSGDQSTFGADVPTAQVRPGDLLFFATDGNGSRRVSHVGMVTEVRGPQQVQFIHSSSSLGVKEDNLYIPYWQRCFLKASRPNLVARGTQPVAGRTLNAAAAPKATANTGPSLAELLRTLGAQ